MSRLQQEPEKQEAARPFCRLFFSPPEATGEKKNKTNASYR